MPSDLTKTPIQAIFGQQRVENRLPSLLKEKKVIGVFDGILLKFAFLRSSSVSASPIRHGIRGQGSVEYLFVVVFLVGFIVSVLVPALQTAEISYALAGARTAAVGYEANHSDIRLTRMNYSVGTGAVTLNLTVYNRSSDTNIATPQGLKDAMLSGIHVLAPTYAFNVSCASTSNYDYCVVS